MWSDALQSAPLIQQWHSQTLYVQTQYQQSLGAGRKASNARCPLEQVCQYCIRGKNFAKQYIWAAKEIIRSMVGIPFYGEVLSISACIC